MDRFTTPFGLTPRAAWPGAGYPRTVWMAILAPSII